LNDALLGFDTDSSDEAGLRSKSMHLIQGVSGWPSVANRREAGGVKEAELSRALSIQVLTSIDEISQLQFSTFCI
jgi:hypothetical protein